MNKIYGSIASLLLVLLLVAACRPAERPVGAPGPAVPEIGEPEVTASPAITAMDQSIADKTVTIASVNAPEAGWLVVHADVNGKPGSVVGHSRVEAGVSRNVIVTVDASLLTSTLHAMLHTDQGVVGRYEFPGPDVPMKDGEDVIGASFRATNVGATGASKDSFNESSGPLKEFTLKARQFQFDPDTITVNKGDRVRLTITAEDVSYGFAVAEFGVSEQIPTGETKVIEFVASRQGTFVFFCSAPCGNEHLNMKGKLIVNLG